MKCVSGKFVAVSFVASFLSLLLAIWGWGDFEGFFAHPARMGLVIGVIAYVGASWFSGTSGVSSGRREMTSNRWVLFPFLFLGIAAAWFVPYAEARNWWTIGGEAARYWGLGFFLIGAGIRLAGVFALGSRFSVLIAVQAGHQLKTDGIFGVVRHPGYLGALTATVGWGLIFRSGVGLLITLFLLVPIIRRIQAEEKFLHEEFGEEYAAYCRQTRWRLVPFMY